MGAIKPMDQDEQQLQNVISEIITIALRDTLYPVDFSIYATCPRAEIDPLDMPVIYPVNYDALGVSVSAVRRNRKNKYRNTTSMSLQNRVFHARFSLISLK